MSNYNFPKITFNDKADSWVLNDNSKYVLTADNINEIKRVVNSLSLALENSVLKFSEIYAYLRLAVPSDLTVGCDYNIKVDISTSTEFTNCISFSLSNNSNKFFIFDDEDENKWISFGNNKITSEYKNRILSIDIEDLILEKGLTYFGRYKFENLTNPSENTQYIGFCLGTYNEGNSNVKKKTFSEIILSGVSSSAKFELYSGETEEFKIVGKTYEGQLIDITNYTNLYSLNEAIDVSDKTITINDVSSPCTCNINFDVTYDDLVYQNTQEIFIRPISFINIYSSLPSIITKDTPTTINYTVSGMTSYNELIELPVSAVKFNFLNYDFITAANGVCNIDKSKIKENETIKYIASYSPNDQSSFNNIIDIKEIKIDLPFTDSFTINVSTVDPSNMYKNFKDCINNTEYKITVTSNGTDITDNTTIENALDIDSVQLSENIIKCTSSEKTPVLLKITYKIYGKTIERHKYLMFKPATITDVEISEFNRTIEDDKIFVNLAFVSTIDNILMTDLAPNSIELVSGNPDLVDEITRTSILFNKPSRFFENLCFKAKYTGFEKLFVITLEV